MLKAYRALISFLPRLWTNWITLFGAVITSMSAVVILTALAIDVSSDGLNAYAATIVFLVMPAVFLGGLALIPLGLYRERRRQRKLKSPVVDPLLDGLQRAMASAEARWRVFLVLLMTVLNVLIVAIVSYRGVTFMETPRFCGNTCHSVMQPEYDAYKLSPHSQVACVECHIGSGAASAVHAKVNGIHQLVGVVTGKYHRPIQTPVHDLRPANETCGHCHQPAKNFGQRLDFRVRYKDDEANSPQITALMFNLGGTSAATGEAHGIHWHASPRVQVRYEVLDDKREKVGRIEKVVDGKVVETWLPPQDQSEGKVLHTRVMDCTDCHNRATHVYDPTPEAAINRALTQGLLDRKVPWLRQMALAALADARPERDGAVAAFRQALDAQYGRAHPAQKPGGPALDAAAQSLASLYLRNIYPRMNLGWNQYPSQIGHNGPDPGETRAQCFRCHSGNHKTAAGKELSSKCESCHEVVAKDELPADLPDEIRPLAPL
jgi:NapC/NirT cytochrome c family protein